MPSFPPAIVALLSVFANALTEPTFNKSVNLLAGVILAPGRRTIASALRALGLADDPHFTNYHRILNRAQWFPLLLSKLLLALIIRVCLPAGAPLLLVVDETIERRWARKIKYVGWVRDPVRSVGRKVAITLGIRWQCLTILVPVPWSQRLWALPFLVIPALPPKVNARLKKRHHSLPEWASLLITRIRRWQPDRDIVLIGDGTYASLSLARRCQGFSHPVRLVAHLRLDARLYAPPPQPVPGKRGRKPQKGARLPSLAERIVDPATPWTDATVPWYGGEKKAIQFVSGTALWHRSGGAPVPLRWVIVRCPDETLPPKALFCTDPSVSAIQIIAWFIVRWNIEVTIEEMHAHLGFETQRYWSERASERTTPCLFGLFSLVVLMAKVLYPHHIAVRQAAWYTKSDATFIDVLAAVRCALWRSVNYNTSCSQANSAPIPQELISSLIEIACYSTWKWPKSRTRERIALGTYRQVRSGNLLRERAKRAAGGCA